MDKWEEEERERLLQQEEMWQWWWGLDADEEYQREMAEGLREESEDGQ